MFSIKSTIINKTIDSSPKQSSAQLASMGNTEISNFRTSVIEAARFRPA